MSYNLCLGAFAIARVCLAQIIPKGRSRPVRLHQGFVDVVTCQCQWSGHASSGQVMPAVSVHSLCFKKHTVGHMADSCHK